MRRILPSLLLCLLSLALAAPTANAQRANPVTDSLVVVQTDSARTASNSWLVALLKKIARRSDDSLATDSADPDRGAAESPAAPIVITRAFSSRRDSLAYESARASAERSKGFRVVVDIFAHQLFVIDGADTLHSAPVATAMNSTLSFGGKSWRFETPRGMRKVLAKDKDPVWTPPEWHYAEVALEHQLKLRHLQRGQTVRLRDGTRLTTRGDEVGIIEPGEKEFVPLVLDEHVVFDNTLFIPPAGTKHRSIQGELGHFRLALGDGYLLHGTPYTNSIGSAVTHGCIRMNDEDIEWLYDNIPVGTKVYLY